MSKEDNQQLSDLILVELKENEDFKLLLEEVDSILKQNEKKLEDHKSLVFTLRTAMEYVENGSDGKNLDKKKFALGIVTSLIKSSQLEEEKKNHLLEMIDNGTLEETIEFVVEASKGNIKLNKKTKRKLINFSISKFLSCFLEKCGKEEQEDDKKNLSVDGKAVHIHKPEPELESNEEKTSVKVSPL